MRKFWFRLCLSAALMSLPVLGASTQKPVTQATGSIDSLPTPDSPFPCPPCIPTTSLK